MLKLEIVTPERKVVDATVDSVTVPTTTGEAGILPNHAPLISALKPGILSYTNGGSVAKMVVAGGFVEVSGNKVSVLADSAETADEINLDRARADREEAEKALLAVAASSIDDTEEIRERFETANVRLQLASGK